MIASIKRQEAVKVTLHDSSFQLAAAIAATGLPADGVIVATYRDDDPGNDRRRCEQRDQDRPTVKATTTFTTLFTVLTITFAAAKIIAILRRRGNATLRSLNHRRGNGRSRNRN